MKVRLLAFTEAGYALARRLAEALDGEAARCGAPLGLGDWTEDAFAKARAIVFVGAAGIAVRAVAPHVRSKASDPAVVVVDEGGRFAIPILSGHLGGANDLARKIAALCGAVPVITTATDTRGLFAVDEWAKRQNCAVQDTKKIKLVSGRLLAGKPVRVSSDFPIAGELPAGVISAEEGADVRLTLRKEETEALVLVPRIAVLGVGCRKGTGQEDLEAALRALPVSPLALSGVCSIDLKGEEPGLLAFCRAHGLELETFTAERLRQAPGEYSASAFVERVTGVDNVCERAAALGSGGGTLLIKKQAGGGVTMAVAVKPFAPDWRWQDE